MTNATTPQPTRGTGPASAALRSTPEPRGGGLTGAVAAEWTKLWSVRSTGICLLSSAVLVALYVTITGIARQSAASDPPGPGLGAPIVAAVGVMLMGQFAVITLATLMIASEYSTGSIRSTLQSVPRRGRMLLAKSIVVLPVLFVTGVLLGLIGVGVAIPALGDTAPSTGVGDTLTSALSIGGYLGLLGVMVVGLGAAVRSVAGTLTTVFLLILILPMSLQATGVTFLETMGDYFPGSAGMALMQTAEGQQYGRDVAVLVLAVWAVAGGLLGYVVLRQRDA